MQAYKSESVPPYVADAPAVEVAARSVEDATVRANALADFLQSHLERLLGAWPTEAADQYPPRPTCGQVERLNDGLRCLGVSLNRLDDLICRVERL